MAERIVLITGGAKRLGAAVTNLLIEKGCFVIIHVRRSVAEAEELLARANKKFGRVCGAVLQGDLSHQSDVESMLEWLNSSELIREHGLFGLIHNASNYTPIPIGELTGEDMDDLYHLHMRSPLTLSNGLFEPLSRGHGSIVGIIDTSWKRHWKGLTHYTATKAGLRQILTNLAGEYAPHVRVNSIGPGAILAADWEEEHFQHVLGNVPMDRPGSPSDIAHAVLHFLESNHLNGIFLPVDGGWDLNMNQ
ncbi:MAG: SDR family NAD(P)-dependent oxidoreductase [Candidatus Poseidoniales archaeon]